MQEKQQKFRDELEDITKELVKLNNEAERLQYKIDHTDEVEENAELKELCNEQMILENKIKSKEDRRNHLINLLNTAVD